MTCNALNFPVSANY